MPDEPTPAPDPPSWPDRFLIELAKTANVSLSADLAGIHRDTAYDLRSRNADFARRWADALESAVDDLAAEARRRAMGWQEPYYFAGEEAGFIFKYSDPLMTFLLAAHRPAVYGKNRVEHSHSGGLTISYVNDWRSMENPESIPDPDTTRHLSGPDPPSDGDSDRA